MDRRLGSKLVILAPPMKTVARAWLRPLQRFLEIEAVSGVVLAGATILALIWANSPWADTYQRVLTYPLGSGPHAPITPGWLIDDVLMTVFFFVVGLEIRRELSIGELSDRKRAALPFLAALGGMAVPAGIYLAVAGDAATRSGWGIPTATDIAFAVGVLTLLGTRVPHGLRVLLLALAVLDDLGAILVIAVFYTQEIRASGLVVAAIAVVVVLAMQRAGVRQKLAFALPALALWAGLLSAGIHPTIAGVVLGLLTPVTSDDDAPSPSEAWTALLHPWVAYGVMPLFALANAGVAIGSVETRGAPLRVMLGITLGLVVGKPLGIGLASALAIRSKLASAPEGLGGRHLLVLGVVGGVGFTMALFVSELAFADPALLDAARAAVLGASALATLVALVIGAALLPKGGGAADRS